MKKCTRCNLIKKLSMFYKDGRAADGLCSECKLCHNADMREWNASHVDDLKRLSKRWYLAHLEETKEKNKRWANIHPEKVKEIGRKTKKKQRSTAKGKLTFNVRCAVWRTIKKGSKNNRRLEELLNYTIDHLKKHLEKNFKIGMTWENYGTYWHIDHIIPISVFNFDSPEDFDFKRCWALNNLRPLEAKENRRKQAKLDNPFQPTLTMGKTYERQSNLSLV